MDVGTGLAIYGIGKIAQHAIPAIMRFVGPSLTKKAADAEYYADGRKTDAKAERIIQLAEAEALAGERVLEISHRARMRAIVCEVEQQKNIESIAREVALLTYENNIPDPGVAVESDWITEFRECCKNTSDKVMQSLWARILAGEIEKPGTFSLRTVDFLRTLRKSEAELFSKFCIAVFRVFHDKLCLVPNPNSVGNHLKISSEVTIKLSELLDLESIGLIQNATLGADDVHYLIDEEVFFVQKNGSAIRLMPTNGRNISVPMLRLSPIGRELFSIARPSFDAEYFNSVADGLLRMGLQVEKGRMSESGFIQEDVQKNV